MESGQPESRDRTILAVDDEKLNLKLLSKMLEPEGYRVLCASSAEEAWALLATVRPRLILMDIRLGGIDGLEATRHVRADPRFASIPVLGVSAYAMTEDVARARQAGCVGYLSKPFDRKELLKTVRDLIGD